MQILAGKFSSFFLSTIQIMVVVFLSFFPKSHLAGGSLSFFPNVIQITREEFLVFFNSAIQITAGNVLPSSSRAIKIRW